MRDSMLHCRSPGFVLRSMASRHVFPFPEAKAGMYEDSTQAVDFSGYRHIDSEKVSLFVTNLGFFR